jgi:DNA invertase Pin-like site-specific DNA recombinase
MKVVAYLRVSTDRQVERGLGLAVQEQAIRKWAKQARHSLVSVARDEGQSGSNGIESRIGLGDALAALKNRQAAGLVVYRLDRLARDLVLQEQLLAEIRRMGAEVFSTSAAEAAYLADDPGDPSRRLIRQVLGAVAEYERAMIRLRLAAGRARKAETGRYAYGGPPFGWRAEGGELVEDPEEQAALAVIRSMHAAGASSREIARALDAGGHKPKSASWRDGKRRAKRWHSQQVLRIIGRLDEARLG